MSSNKQITVLIADDEEPARDVIRVYLEKDNRFKLISECVNGQEALEMINYNLPDIVFLDIEMPELTGISLAGKLKDYLPKIVFITAFKEYAIKAFEENAIDYILKPFSEDRFQKMLDRIATATKQTNDLSFEVIQGVIEKLQLKEESFLKKIPVKKKGKIRFIQVHDVVWIESDGAYLKLHLKDQSKELVSFSMKELENKLDSRQHIRIHKSYMVNIEEIESMEPYFHGEYILIMSDGTELKLSRSYKEKLDQILNQYKH